ncbi:alpha/beta fold hydrolase [Thermoflexus sp.]|uniref:alpha/beta hydrolase n=1 Tax=Thermoflexus sp. TaxID=1969742 RepID=UPI003333F6C1
MGALAWRGPAAPGWRALLLLGWAVRRPSGPRLHGAPREMRGLGRFLAAHGWTALGIRLPGHGTRPEDLRGFTWRDWAEAVATGVDVLRSRCARVFLCGLSLGGILVLHEAARRPPDGLIAMAVPYRIRDLRLYLLGIWKRLFPEVGRPPARPTAALPYPRYSLQAVEEVLRALRAMRAALPDARAPALLIYSWADRTVRPDQGWEVYHRLGSADKVIHWLARSGHGIPEDIDREEAFEAVLRFLRRRIPER